MPSASRRRSTPPTSPSFVRPNGCVPTASQRRTTHTKTGTHDIAPPFNTTNHTAADFGVDKVADILNADLAPFNALVREDLVNSLADVTTDKRRIYGVSNSGTMVELDEHGRAPTQVQGLPPTAGFPLRLFAFALGWTEKAMQVRTPRDLAIAQNDAQTAYLRMLQRELKKSIYLSANYTFVDHLIDKQTIDVKRLYNADSTTIPNGPNGETFNGATHSHYIGASSLTAAAVTSLIATVVEHGSIAGPIIVAISATDETAFRALTGFIPAADPRTVLSIAADQIRPRADIYAANNRLIGYFGAAEVWVKSWAIANYILAYDADGSNKPLAMRQRESTSLQGLRISATIKLFPLTAENMEAEFGFGVWNRQKAAVLYFANSTYADPTIT